MAANRKPGDEPEWGLFTCTGCGRKLDLPSVVAVDVERRRGYATGYVVVVHTCSCASTAGEHVVSRRWASYPSFVALFGAVPLLPYRAPAVAGRTVAEEDVAVAHWRWELEQVGDVADFLRLAG